jgi:hypothetical protein
MGIWEKLLKAERSIRKRIENAFGPDMTQTLLEVRREILEQVESRIMMDANGKVFPFGKVVVLLQPPAGILHDAFETAFLQGGSLKEDILKRLKDAEARHPDELGIVVQLQAPDLQEPKLASRSLFRLDFVKPDPLSKRKIPETDLVIAKGSAEQASYRMKKERILIGRLSEVLDREGRMVRKNDVVFLDNGDEINSTVGRAHARIWFDPETQGFRIMDEISHYGTRIVREGRSIEVPGGNPRGIRLQSGDEIYCGQACLRFRLISTAEAT